MKNLAELVRQSGILNTSTLYSDEAIEAGKVVNGLTDDSRRVKPGYIFVAVKGLEHDGHDHIAEALGKGAVIVYQDRSKIKNQRSKIQIKNQKFTEIRVKNSREALGLLWSAWYGHPSRKLKIIGVTGTDGKTTTVNLIYHLLKRVGKKVGMVSTVNARIGKEEIETGFHVTSPEPELLQKLLAQMVEKKMEYAVLEVTSHGLDQERIAGIKFDAAVLTNVTHEHLDYHKTYPNYLQTKAKLFKNVQFSILNRDDASFINLERVADGKRVTYGIKEKADLMAENINGQNDYNRFTLKVGGGKTTPLYSDIVNLALPGIYNIYNVLAAAAVCLELRLSLEQVTAGLSSFEPLTGRFEEIRLSQPFRVIIDFAHTPNALAQVLELISKIKDQNSKTICVFGCAGERDRQKRPMMGDIAGRLADLSVLTAEDPRREDVVDIINSIAEGCRKAGATEIFNFQPSTFKSKNKSPKNNFFVRIPDRRVAIAWAIRNAQKNDIVLITGKGHEKSMSFGTKEYPWRDQKVARDELQKLGYGRKR